MIAEVRIKEIAGKGILSALSGGIPFLEIEPFEQKTEEPYDL